MNDVVQAFRFASNLFQRSALAIAATLYAVMTLFAPDTLSAHNTHAALVFAPEQKYILAAIFGLDAACLWWRLADPVARLWWARAINGGTALLWVLVTGLTLYVYGRPLPDAVGLIMLSFTALYTTIRTDYTARDRQTA
jgi:hypothetical protein